jgi:hypothetical protein
MSGITIEDLQKIRENDTFNVEVTPSRFTNDASFKRVFIERSGGGQSFDINAKHAALLIAKLKEAFPDIQ